MNSRRGKTTRPGKTSSSSTDVAIEQKIPELDAKGLRHFGLTTGAAVVAIFGLLIPWVFEFDWPAWPWVVATPLWLLAVIYPLFLRPVYRAWMHFGLFASRIMTPLVLGIVFFAMIAPMAVVRRLMGKDAMQRKLDANQESYRVKSSRSPPEKLERPF